MRVTRAQNSFKQPIACWRSSYRVQVGDSGYTAKVQLQRRTARSRKFDSATVSLGGMQVDYSELALWNVLRIFASATGCDHVISIYWLCGTAGSLVAALRDSRSSRVFPANMSMKRNNTPSVYEHFSTSNGTAHADPGVPASQLAPVLLDYYSVGRLPAFS